jgi:hypothetical protein
MSEMGSTSIDDIERANRVLDAIEDAQADAHERAQAQARRRRRGR